MNFYISKFIIAIFAIALYSSAAQAIVVNYGAIGSGSGASVVAGDTTVTGSSNVFYNDSFSTSTNGGLGVQGGGSNNSLDLGETLTFDFDFLVSDVLMTVTDIAPPGNVTYGFNAFNGATDLGFFGLPNHVTTLETFDLSLLVGQAFDSFTISLSVSAPIGLVIEQLEYTRASVPEPAPLALLAFGLAAMGFVRRRKIS